MNLRPFVRTTLLVASAVATCGVARADESDAYAGRASGAPSLVVLADTSAAALAPGHGRPAYEAAAWAGRRGCEPGRVYWRRGGGPPPACESSQWVPTDSSVASEGQRCAAVVSRLGAAGWATVPALVQWSATERRWRSPRAGARAALECEADAGRHGDRAGPVHAADGDDDPWTTRALESIEWSEHRGAYTLYSAAYVAWWHHAPRAAPRERRIPQRLALDALAPAWAATVALLRPSWNAEEPSDSAAEGGTVLEVRDGARTALSLVDQPFGGPFPLAEALYEASAYLAGLAVDYGRTAAAPPGTPRPSAPAARLPGNGTRYASPLRHACARATVLAFAAGEPAADEGAPSRIAELERALAAHGGPPGPSHTRCGADGAAPCAGVLAGVLARADLATLPGRQTASVEWAALDAPARWLDVIATHGGRRVPGEPDALPSTLAALGFDRYGMPPVAGPWSEAGQIGGLAIAGDAVYATTFVPSRAGRWTGDLRRHALVRDEGGTPRVPSLDRAPSPRTTGGVSFAERLPPPDARRVYTDASGPDLTDARNAVRPENRALDAGRLGLAATGHGAPGTERARVELLQWLRGADVDDADGDGDRRESRRELGAMHQSPVVLLGADGERTVFAGSADGLLHAFDGAGRERWAYVPGVLLESLGGLREAAPSGRRRDGVGGELRLHLAGDDGDGRLDATRGERALLYLALRRGGRAYVALDVTHPAQPRHLWTLTPRELPALGQTWAAPVPARLTLAGSGQHASGLVVVLAGGYDPALDRGASRARDRLGAGLHLVDGWSGRRLWSASAQVPRDALAAAGPARPSHAPAVPHLLVPGLRYAIAATPRVIDLDGDGELDLVYVADTGGQLWRFAFERGAPASRAARATRIAALGGAGAADRRFHAEPDVAQVVSGPGTPYLAVTLGSGAAAEPLDLRRADRLYSIREPLDAYGRPRDTATAVTDAELPEANGPPLGPEARGWKRTLSLAGEKILVPALTVDHVAHVPAYAPPAEPLAPDCTRRPGTNRLHAIDVRDGRAVPARAARDARAGRSTAVAGDGGAGADGAAPAPLVAGGPAPALTLAVLAPAADCSSGCVSQAVGLVGAEAFSVPWPGRVVRTGWAEREPR